MGGRVYAEAGTDSEQPLQRFAVPRGPMHGPRRVVSQPDFRAKTKQVPRGYIRCDYFIVCHCVIVYDVIDKLFTLKSSFFRHLKITRDRPMDLRTYGRTDTTSYRDG